MTRGNAILLLVAAMTASLFAFVAASQRTGAQQATVHVVQVKGAIGVGTSIKISEALAEAARADAAILVVKIDTPGRLINATREIIQTILASPIPVAVFVAPGGARAASAGTYIAYSAHIVGMAPGTHLGAATTVQMKFPALPQQPPNQSPRPAPTDKSKPPDGKSTVERKVLNDAITHLRSLAQLRGRSEAWANKFVHDAATLTAREAHKEQIVDAIAMDVVDFVRQIDGRIAKTASDEKILNVQIATIRWIGPGWWVRLLDAIADPNIAFVLMLIGIYGIIFEFWSPGLTGSGVIGAISLVVAMFALSALPLSYAGLALLLLGLALMVGEAVAPGVGILGIGGVIAFILGAIFLFDPAGADIDVAVYTPLIAATAITSALLLIGLFGFLLRARRVKVASGSEELIGLTAEVLSWRGASGRIRVHGEIWAARSTKKFATGSDVKVIARDGLTLFVE